MKTNATQGDRRSGSALIIIMYVCLLLAVIGTIGWKLAGTSAIRTRRYANRAQALALAEAGVATMYENLQSNAIVWTGQTVTQTLGRGYFIASAVKMNDGVIHILSTGRVDQITASTAFEVLTSGDATRGPIIFSGLYGIVADGNVILETTAMDVNGNIHANRNIENKKGNPRVHGHLTACGTIAVTPQPGYTATEGGTYIELPNYDPFIPWKELAQNGGIYINGDYNIGKIDIRPGNGVLYAEGNIKVENQSTMVGTLVAKGNIIIENLFFQTQFQTNWPCMLAAGNIQLLNRNDYEGSFYTCGNFTTRNNKEIAGGIIALGNIEIQNNCDVNPRNAFVLDPNTTVQTDLNLDVGGWLR